MYQVIFSGLQLSFVILYVLILKLFKIKLNVRHAYPVNQHIVV